MTLEDLSVRVEAAGLACRGGFHPDEGDLPATEKHLAGRATLVMLGFTGHTQWPVFAASPEGKDGKPHPLDRWSYRVIRQLAQDLGAVPYFPFTAPLMPFIRWAQKAEAVFPSEIGMLIHPDHGLWHAWRGALLLSHRLDLPTRDERSNPCDNCHEKPCLSACPVGAMKGDGNYDIPVCVPHIRSSAGASCMSGGCLARRACPVAQDNQYTPEQAAFHMKSFRGG